MGYLIGDVLIAAAFLSYIGPFLSNYRENLVVKKWLVEVCNSINWCNHIIITPLSHHHIIALPPHHFHIT